MLVPPGTIHCCSIIEYLPIYWQFQLQLGDYFKVYTFGAQIAEEAMVLIGWLNNHGKAVQPERITIEVPEAPDEVPSVGTVAVTQECTRKGYTVLGSMMGLQRSFRQRSLHAIWVSLRSAKKKEVPERRTEPID
ncbi:hypothetical protein F5890DRAFT_1569643 [Lentinula detonsa]|uniref:Uncharacterized protein n=1 Tax=Lentinula detonsa TaxID=2804962 RepID=A0AA38UNV6_9AGAR|nr:hypothetical protein F5890DRAFT_1569643 [Lentinula detonsa]